MKIPQCNFCERPAAWRRPVDGDRLCVAHFNKSFIRRVQRTINRYKLFTRKDIIGVGISGGKDSVVLLDVLAKLQKKYPTKLIGITIDEGIENYRQEGLKYAREATERAGIDHHIFSYKEKFGHDLDTALILLGPNRQAACSICGPFRRKSLNEAAREIGADKLATGHNADDEAQTFLMNIFRGDMLKSLHSNPYPRFKNESFINRVKPLRKSEEQEIVLYANFNNLPYQETPCPYAVEAARGKVRDILTNYQEHDPAIIYSILNSADAFYNLSDNVPRHIEHDGNKPIIKCERCGEPSNNQFCGTCKIVIQIENNL
ncbi:MAG: tRNA 2-thiocytidine biosynthesis protein TtcA [Candidatus Heimdallarchaeota archaeon LC_2]|nr:MAG: tRNA 2-thiocytidine biosynthesis protein TtcA [Candidatus Heimdallarchaeota archaeon LC_2]